MSKAMSKARLWLVVTLILVVGAGAAFGWQLWQQHQHDQRVRGELHLSATVTQTRPAKVAHLVQVAVRNEGPFPVTVLRAELVAPPLVGAGPSDVDVILKANPPGGDGYRLNISLPYAAQCPDGEIPPAEQAHANLLVRTADGREREIQLQLPYPSELLDRLVRLDCERELIARTAQVAFGQWSIRTDGTSAVNVTLRHAGAPHRMTVYDVAGSVLYNISSVPRDTPRPLGTLEQDDDELTLPVVIDAHRCTGHALGEAKEPFLFPIWIAFGGAGGGPYIYSAIPIAPEDETELRALTERRCADRLDRENEGS